MKCPNARPAWQSVGRRLPWLPEQTGVLCSATEILSVSPLSSSTHSCPLKYWPSLCLTHFTSSQNGSLQRMVCSHKEREKKEARRHCQPWNVQLLTACHPNGLIDSSELLIGFHLGLYYFNVTHIASKSSSIGRTPLARAESDLVLRMKPV